MRRGPVILTSCSIHWRLWTETPSLPLHLPPRRAKSTPPANLQRHSQKSACLAKFLPRTRPTMVLSLRQRQCHGQHHPTWIKTTRDLECKELMFPLLWRVYEKIRTRTMATSCNHLLPEADMAAAETHHSKLHKLRGLLATCNKHLPSTQQPQPW